MSVKKLTLLALYTTLALAIYAAESLLPPLVPSPGIKLGLANIITLFVLSNHSAKDAFCVLLARVLIAGVLFGQALSLLYSLAGGILCLMVMTTIHHLLQKHFLPLTSIFGALAHNAGQLIVAVLIVKSVSPLAYLPFFILSAIVTGLFTGFCAFFAQKTILPHIKHLLTV